MKKPIIVTFESIDIGFSSTNRIKNHATFMTKLIVRELNIRGYRVHRVKAPSVLEKSILDHTLNNTNSSTDKYNELVKFHKSIYTTSIEFMDEVDIIIITNGIYDTVLKYPSVYDKSITKIYNDMGIRADLCINKCAKIEDHEDSYLFDLKGLDKLRLKETKITRINPLKIATDHDYSAGEMVDMIIDTINQNNKGDEK